MVARSVSWRRICPEDVANRMDEALRVTFYIVHQAGPTAFILKEEGAGKKAKVFLGDPHMCSCSLFKKTHELCVHILWLLLRKFRIPPANPVVWQLGLVEREISEILRGYLCHQSPSPTTSKKGRSKSRTSKIPQREIGPDDVCPICQDDLLGSTHRITYCQFSCGKSVHVKCMKIWAEHQKSTGELTLRCPLCREDFGSIMDLTSIKSSRLTGSDQSYQHLGTTCSHCHVCPIVGKCYKCTTCACYHLCHDCFSSNQVHLLHSFHFRQHSNQPWRPVSHPSSTRSASPSSGSPSSIPSSIINALQARSLTESDYEILLSLDTSSPPHPHVVESLPHSESRPHPPHPEGRRRSVPERVIASLQVEALDGTHALIITGARCSLCNVPYTRGDWVKKLPCKHKFHRGCIDEWLHAGHTSCPVDGKAVLQTHPRHRANGNGRHAVQQVKDGPPSSGRRHVIAPLTRARPAGGSHDPEDVEFTVSGQGIREGGGATLTSATKEKRKKTKSHINTSATSSNSSQLQSITITTMDTMPNLPHPQKITTAMSSSLLNSSKDIHETIVLSDKLSPSHTIHDPTQVSPPWPHFITNALKVSHPQNHALSQSGTRLPEKVGNMFPEVGNTGPAKLTSGGKLRKGLNQATERGAKLKKHTRGSELIDKTLQISQFKLCPVSYNHSLVAATTHTRTP